MENRNGNHVSGNPAERAEIREFKNEMGAECVMTREQFNEIIADNAFGKEFAAEFDKIESKLFMNFKQSVSFSNGQCHFTFDNTDMEKSVDKIFVSINNDYKKLTEFVGLLNQRLWAWYYKSQDNTIESIVRFYRDNVYCTYDMLWEKYDNWCTDNLNDYQLDYYYKTLD